jgi:hypothetical protein
MILAIIMLAISNAWAVMAVFYWKKRGEKIEQINADYYQKIKKLEEMNRLQVWKIENRDEYIQTLLKIFREQGWEPGMG